MHAVASEPKFAKPPVEQRAAGWLWPIKRAMDGTRTASKDFGDFVADVMKEIQFERGKADPHIYKDTTSNVAIVFHVDDPILATHQQTAQVWKRNGDHMLLKERTPSDDTRQTNQVPQQTVCESARTQQTGSTRQIDFLRKTQVCKHIAVDCCRRLDGAVYICQMREDVIGTTGEEVTGGVFWTNYWPVRFLLFASCSVQVAAKSLNSNEEPRVGKDREHVRRLRSI